jgi:polyribonucleotide 5'-hydroxyl-kinase
MPCSNPAAELKWWRHPRMHIVSDPLRQVVGPTDSGKSTLCKILTNYAVRQHSAPVLVDLDIGERAVPQSVQLLVPVPSGGPQRWAGLFCDRILLTAGQGSLTPPGTICATPCEAPIDVEDGLAVEVPLVYYFGHVSPSENDVSGD